MTGQVPSPARATARWQKKYPARRAPPVGARHMRPSIQLWSSHPRGAAARRFELLPRWRIGPQEAATRAMIGSDFGASDPPWEVSETAFITTTANHGPKKFPWRQGGHPSRGAGRRTRQLDA